MSESRATSISDSADDPVDDGQLTIRIPNPKVYMARQSQWKGRRGKPRCDHCRLNNLKCDRVLPTCNHCSWANGRECKYTPLPTPAHRGIPRCDRCRLKNLKCDRNLPVCNHCGEEENTECNYTPKKRHKVPLEQGPSNERQTAPYGNKAASFLVSGMSVVEDLTKPIGDREGHSFYGHNVASSSSRFQALSSSTVDDYSGIDGSRKHSRPLPQKLHTSIFSMTSHSPLHAKTMTNNLSFISHSFPGDQGVLISRSFVDPWTHPSFTPLPDHILQRLAALNSVEMPYRYQFSEAFERLLAGMYTPIRDTAAFPPDVYARMWRSLVKGDTSKLPDRLRLWLSSHRVRHGSEKTCLLIMPHEEYFGVKLEEDRLRSDYATRIDGKGDQMDTGDDGGAVGSGGSGGGGRSSDHVLDSSGWSSVWERIPVADQIYDILVYCHRAHASATSMLVEVRRMGFATITWPMTETFVRLCPLCNLRGKPTTVSSRGESSFSAFDPNSVMR